MKTFCTSNCIVRSTVMVALVAAASPRWPAPGKKGKAKRAKRLIPPKWTQCAWRSKQRLLRPNSWPAQRGIARRSSACSSIGDCTPCRPAVWNGKQIAGIGEWIMNRGKIPVARVRRVRRGVQPREVQRRGVGQVAKDAGMKYMVITSKHHDGFAMFESKSARTISSTPRPSNATR